MPRRKNLLINNEIYHVFNRGIAGLPIFKSVYDYRRMIGLIDFYRFERPLIRYSHYIRLPKDKKEEFINRLYKEGEEQVKILAFTLMPSHYHFQLKQIIDKGIEKFISNIQNAYARYFNTKYTNIGSLFQLRFKGVRMENEEQFIHVNRYIHLNPLTSFLIKKVDELADYEWSSYRTYTGDFKHDFIDTSIVMEVFNGKRDKLTKFTLDQIDYQRKLHLISRLIIEEKGF